MPTIQTKNLCKTYVSAKREPGIVGAFKTLFTKEKTEKKAVLDVNFTIEQGEIVGFLGPNGAGKTTTIKMLSGIMEPTSGECSVLGFRPADRKPEMLRQISLVMGNKNQLWWDLPAIESFKVFKELYAISDGDFKSRLEFLLEELQLTDKVETQVRKMSLGERMKCELVAALLHRPQVLFLDEPTIGLDVVSQRRVREFLKLLNKEDRCTILLTSHYMQDVQEMCPRVIMINDGQVAFDGPLEDLTQNIDSPKRLRVMFEHMPSAEEIGRHAKVVENFDGGYLLETPRLQTPKTAAEILEHFSVVDIEIEDVPIEEVITKFMAPH